MNEFLQIYKDWLLQKRFEFAVNHLKAPASVIAYCPYLQPQPHSLSPNLHLPEPSKSLLLNQCFVTIPSLHLKTRIQLLLLTPKSSSPIYGFCLNWFNHSTAILPQSLQFITKTREDNPHNGYELESSSMITAKALITSIYDWTLAQACNRKEMRGTSNH